MTSKKAACYIKEPATPRQVAIGYCMWYIGMAVTPAHDDEIKKVENGFEIPLYSALYLDGGNILMTKHESFEVGSIKLSNELKITRVTSNKEIDKVIKKRKLKFIEELIANLKQIRTDIRAINV